MVRCVTQIHSAVHCNTKFNTGRDPTIPVRANCSPNRWSVAVELLRAYCKQRARPAVPTTVGRALCSPSTASFRGEDAGLTSAFHGAEVASVTSALMRLAIPGTRVPNVPILERRHSEVQRRFKLFVRSYAHGTLGHGSLSQITRTRFDEWSSVRRPLRQGHERGSD
jgi:hypothetical protein